MGEHRITVMPSGHQFFALEQETLLDAALRSGLNINFSCASGSCGDCHARLVEGTLGEHDHQDHRFSALEKAQGMFLLCTAHAAGDLVIEAGEAKSPGDIPLQRITTRLHRLEEVDAGLRILQLKTPRTGPLRFLAGQHVELRLPGVGTLDSSIASCPCNGQQLQFHIPYDVHNPFTRRLFDGLRHGTALDLIGPYGEVTLDDDSARPLLMLAQGHELAPIKSLIEHAINLDLGQSIRLIWLAREGGHYLENHCRSWAEALDDYRYIPLEHAPGEEAGLQASRLLRGIAEQIEGLGRWDIYLAGSQAFSQALKQGLIAAGADPQRLFSLRHRSLPRLPQGVASG